MDADPYAVGRCASSQRRRMASDIRCRPSGVVGPVDSPPCSLQRMAPRFVRIALHWQGVPRRVRALQNVFCRIGQNSITRARVPVAK